MILAILGRVALACGRGASNRVLDIERQPGPADTAEVLILRPWARFWIDLSIRLGAEAKARFRNANKIYEREGLSGG
jgi:hypothetical protein